MVDTLVRVMPALVAVLYLLTSLGYAAKRDWPWCLVWFCYALSNVGLILAARSDS